MMQARVWTLDTVRSRCEEIGDCWIWQQAAIQGKYPEACINGKNTRVQRHVYIELLGKKLDKGKVMSTRCENPLCCSPSCVFSLTYSDRARKAYSSGARNTEREKPSRRAKAIAQGWATKLDTHKARAIRLSDKSNAELALEYGVSIKHIASIKRGQHWNDSRANSSVFRMAA